MRLEDCRMCGGGDLRADKALPCEGRKSEC